MFTAFAHWRVGKLVLLLALCLLLPGCKKSKVTQENFDKIKNDMTLKEVEAILGEGTREGGDGANIAAQAGVDVTGGALAQSSSTIAYVWESGNKKITVFFNKQDQVVNKRSESL